MREKSSQSMNTTLSKSYFRGGETKVMKKLLSSVLAFALVLTLLVPAFAFAAEKTTKEKFDILFKAEILSGVNAAGDAGLDQTLTRAELAKVLVKILDRTATPGNGGFTDVAADHWAATQGWIVPVKDDLMQGVDLAKTKFGPSQKVTFAELAKVVVEALGLEVDTTVKLEGVQDWAAPYVAVALEAGFLPEMENYHADATRGDLVEATFVVFEASQVVDLAMTATASGAKKIAVTFNQAVDTSKATFTVKRGNVVVNFTTTWNDAKTVVTLESPVALMTGDYTLTVSGLDLAVNTATITVTPERIDAIEIDDNGYRNDVPGGANFEKVSLGYKVLNQYGEDLTKTTATANIVVTANGASVNPTSQGVITVDNVSVQTTSLVVTVVDTKFAKTATKTVNVLAKKSVGTVNLGQPVIPAKQTTIKYDNTNVVIPYEALDQFGNKVSLANVDGLTFISSNSTVLLASEVAVVTVGSKDELVIKKFETFNGAKDVTLTVIVNATGKQSKVEFTVYGKSTAKTPMLVAPTKNPGVNEGTAKIELQVYDVYGNAMKPAEIASLFSDTPSGFTIISTNANVFGKVTKTIETDKEKAYVKVDLVGEGTANLMITVNATGETSTVSLTVTEARYPASMTLVPDFTHAVKDGKVTLKATFKDQFGDAIKTSTNAVKFAANNEDFATKPADTTVTAMGTGVGFTAKAFGKSSTYTVTLFAADGTTKLDEKKLTLTSVAADAALTYFVEELGTIAGDQNYTKTSDYAVEVAVYAKDASGNKVSLAGNEIQSVLAGSAAVGADEVATNSFVVFGQKVTADTLTKVFVTVNTNKGVKVLEAPVTVSAKAPYAESIVAMSGTKEVTEVELDEGTYTLAKLLDGSYDLSFVVTDQYGTEALSAASYVTVFIVSDAGITKLDGLTDFEVEADEEYTVTAVTANGLSVSVTVVGK